VGETLEPLAFAAFVAVPGVVAGDEVVQFGALELVLFQSEVLVGSEIVDPQLFGPRLFLCRLCGRRKARWPLRLAHRKCRSADAEAYARLLA